MLGHHNLRTFSTDTIPARYEGIIDEVTLVYETYGQLNEARDNAILVIHGFSANSHVARHTEDDEPGWWDWAVGPGLALDTLQYFVVCANNLGSCFGSSGPTTVNKQTGQQLGSSFPFPTIADIVFCQHELQKELEIEVWRAVIGGSLGGMAALHWAASYPDKVGAAICLNAGARVSHTGYGLMSVQADMIRQEEFRGLRLARQLATLAYLDEEYFQQLAVGDPSWRLTQWLSQEADAFSMRFNPYSYLGFLHAMMDFDCRPSPFSTQPSVMIVGCSEDKLFSPAIIQETIIRFTIGQTPETFMVHSVYGHDAFLLDDSLYAPLLRDAFLR